MAAWTWILDLTAHRLLTDWFGGNADVKLVHSFEPTLAGVLAGGIHMAYRPSGRVKLYKMVEDCRSEKPRRILTNLTSLYIPFSLSSP